MPRCTTLLTSVSWRTGLASIAAANRNLMKPPTVMSASMVGVSTSHISKPMMPASRNCTTGVDRPWVSSSLRLWRRLAALARVSRRRS